MHRCVGRCSSGRSEIDFAKYIKLSTFRFLVSFRKPRTRTSVCQMVDRVLRTRETIPPEFKTLRSLPLLWVSVCSLCKCLATTLLFGMTWKGRTSGKRLVVGNCFLVFSLSSTTTTRLSTWSLTMTRSQWVSHSSLSNTRMDSSVTRSWSFTRGTRRWYSSRHIRTYNHSWYLRMCLGQTTPEDVSWADDRRFGGISPCSVSTSG